MSELITATLGATVSVSGVPGVTPTPAPPVATPAPPAECPDSLVVEAFQLSKTRAQRGETLTAYVRARWTRAGAPFALPRRMTLFIRVRIGTVEVPHIASVDAGLYSWSGSFALVVPSDAPLGAHEVRAYVGLVECGLYEWSPPTYVEISAPAPWYKRIPAWGWAAIGAAGAAVIMMLVRR